MTMDENADSEVENADMIKENENQNKVKKSRRKYPTFRQNLLDYFQEFTDNTGIHGFKYMGKQDRTLCEKLWWFIFFCISLYIGVALIIQFWNKWDRSPVLVGFAKSLTPVWKVPFPAITICSEMKIKQTVYNFTDAFHRYPDLTTEELKLFSDTSLICDNHLFTEGEKITKPDTIDYLMSIAPQFEDVFFTCKWLLLNESCDDLFTPLLTEEGLCYTFNMLDKPELLRDNVYLPGHYLSHGSYSEGWTLEKGYPIGSKPITFPRRTISAGYSAGLTLVLKANISDLDYMCKGPVQGYKIILHHPAEMPKVSMQFHRVSLNQEFVVAVSPDIITTSDGLLVHNPQRRQCFFPTEKYLSYYHTYTQQNCQSECLANFTLAKCGCVSYHMPHEKGTPICGPGNQQCMILAQTDLLEMEMVAGINSFESNIKQSLPNCDCLPACTSLSYNAEFSQASYDWEKLFETYGVNVTSEFPGIQLTRLTFFFKDQQFITSERNELYGRTDFLANCGGILFFFTGFSFFSLVEIIYFLTLRLMCNIKRYGKHYWSGSPRLVKDED